MTGRNCAAARPLLAGRGLIDGIWRQHLGLKIVLGVGEAARLVSRLRQRVALAIL